MNDTPLLELRRVAVELAREAGELTQRYFRTGVSVDTKADKTPVTIADREAEQLMRKRIQDRYPDHGIIGEEFGRVREDAEYVWVLDPIDGTKSFVNGIPLYTNLIAVLHRGQPAVGVIHAPAMGELADASVGGGCAINGRVARVAEHDPPLCLTSSTGDLFKYQPDFCVAFLKDFPYHRTWADGYGYLMLADGRAQVMLDAVMELWDAAALYPVVTEAGGVFTDWRGEASVFNRCAVAATPGCHEPVMSLIRRFGRQAP